ncbi:MAG: AbrB/MazE/SpoVT family DNA-binding domain-containing protein [Thermoplasmata archaeon]|nr:MAG: AbrB/MazE/SpoVT family DNA-binding domain-containing protein [Thermoplasmata archaeon]
MESRKVQVTGGSTFIVSLPKSWVNDKGINPGDPVWISPMEDGTLLLSPKIKKDRVSRKKVLSLHDESAEHLTRKLIGMYIAGYNTIELKSKKNISPDIHRAIRNFTKMVVGPEIIVEDRRHVVLQDLINPSEFSQKKGIRRMYLLVRSMHTDAITAFTRQDRELARDVILRDGDVDRLDWMIAKQYNLILNNTEIASSVGVSSEKSLNLMLISRIIERIGDHAFKIAEGVKLLDGKDINENIVNEIAQSSDISLKILDKSMNAFFSEDLNEANDTIDMSTKLNKASDALMKKIRDQESDVVVSLASIIESVRRTGLYATDISEIAINYISSLG